MGKKGKLENNLIFLFQILGGKALGGKAYALLANIHAVLFFISKQRGRKETLEFFNFYL